MTVEEAAKHLYGAVETVHLKVESMVPQALAAFNEPGDAPTPYGAAEICLRGIVSKMEELTYAYELLLKALDKASAEGVKVEVIHPPRPISID